MRSHVCVYVYKKWDACEYVCMSTCVCAWCMCAAHFHTHTHTHGISQQVQVTCTSAHLLTFINHSNTRGNRSRKKAAQISNETYMKQTHKYAFLYPMDRCNTLEKWPRKDSCRMKRNLYKRKKRDVCRRRPMKERFIISQIPVIHKKSDLEKELCAWEDTYMKRGRWIHVLISHGLL